MSIMLKRTDL